MTKSKHIIALLVIAGTISLGACTENTTTTEEQVEITTMDSTTTKAKEISDKLEEQTREVEASIENLEKEFSTNN